MAGRIRAYHRGKRAQFIFECFCSTEIRGRKLFLQRSCINSPTIRFVVYNGTHVTGAVGRASRFGMSLARGYASRCKTYRATLSLLKSPGSMRKRSKTCGIWNDHLITEQRPRTLAGARDLLIFESALAIIPLKTGPLCLEGKLPEYT